MPLWPVLLLALGSLAAQASPRDLYARAQQLEEQGNATAALTLLWEAAGAAPRDADIQNALGEALDRLGALDAAVDAFRHALAARPAFPKAVNNLILTLVKAGRGPEAVERARTIVSASPSDAGAWFTLGLAQAEQDVDGAFASFRRALELDPRHVLARYNLALVLKRADRADDAMAELRRAIGIQPRAEAYYSLGVIQWQRGDLPGAVSSLDEAVALDPRYADAYAALGAVLQARRDWRGAEAALRRALALRPTLQSARYTLGRVLQGAGREREAQAAFAEAERLRRDGERQQEASTWTAVGASRLDAGDFAGARDCFRRAIDVSGDYAPAHYQLGRALDRLGDRAGARAAYQRARQLNPALVPPRD